MKKGLLFVPMMICGGLSAQDVHFSQISESPQLLNPATTALGHDFLAELNYKDQWRSVAQPYKTFNASTDFSVMKSKGGSHLGLGINFYSDKAGDANMGTTIGALNFSGVVVTDDNNAFSAGLSGGFGQRSLQYDKLYWDNQFDGLHYNSSLPTGEPIASFSNHSYADVGAGIGWFYGKGHSTLSSNDATTINAGFSAQHLNRPSYSFYGDKNERLPVRWIAHGNADIGIKNHGIVLEPAYLFMMQAGHREITAGMLFKYIPHEASKYTGRVKADAFILGGYYRFGDALIVVTGYQFSSWGLGMSYDVNLSSLRTASKARGGLEISLRFIAPNPFGGGQTTKLFD